MILSIIGQNTVLELHSFLDEGSNIYIIYIYSLIVYIYIKEDMKKNLVIYLYTCLLDNQIT